MGVPKFFRWMSERYPKINQRLGSPPNPETSQRYFDKPPPDPFEQPDPFSKCGLPPEIDRLYIDMNGIIHGCSHNNSSNVEDDGEGFDTVSRISNPDIFRNVCYYLDRIIGDMVQPKEVVYMAIDGVAPRAKLNQQRSRRYRSGTEGSIETSIYDAHEKAMKEKEEKEEQEQIDEDAFSVEDGYSFAFNEENVKDDSKARQDVEEVTPGRFTGKFETQAQEVDGDKEAFHSNVITPGTPFFTEFTQHLEHFVKYKMSTDPKWKDLTIIFSGPNVPGEGEHKIMQFIREQKKQSNYNPNLRHCIMGQDGDLIMLGLATHEPNLVLLRERVIFNMVQQQLRQATTSGLDAYINNAHFELLHMGVLRNYLAYEFETSDVMQEAPWDLEHTIDDFVFMTFFVGNDFLPHMPALDIADNAFDLLFWTYKECRQKWLEEDPEMPYLTNRGSIVSGRRVEEFCTALGSHEVSYYDKKKLTASKENRRLRKEYKRLGMPTTVPNDNVIESKEKADRAAYRTMLQTVGEKEAEADMETFTPVVTGEVSFRSSDEAIEEGLISQMGNILQNSISHESGGEDGEPNSIVDDQDLKGRYYYDKFQISPYDQEKHLALRTAYIEGLVWNLKYYYEGCVSWDWYYPYHYGPMLSDLVDVDSILDEISFDGKMGSPLKPFQQLMGCMPPSQSHHLPEPFRWLMKDENSPIIDFYPKSFTVDMNGKRWPWEAVALLPFIDSQRLIAEYNKIDESLLTEDERRRNSTGSTVVMMYDEGQTENIPAIGVNEGFRAIDESKVISVPFEISDWNYSSEEKAVLEPVLHPGVQVPLAGFSSLRDAPIQSLWRRRNGLNVFGGRSRYLTACLEVSSFMPPLPPVEDLAPKLIGTSVFVNYPHFVEGLVTAVSDENTVVRGRKKPRRWTEKESEKWRMQREGITRCLEIGEGHTGTGGVIIPDDQAVTLSVRPLKGLSTLANGTTVKSYADFEVEVPIISTFWNPKIADSRLNGIPSRLEKNAFDVASPLQQAVQKTQQNPKNGRRRKKLFPPKGNSTTDFSEGMEMNTVAKAHFSTSAFSSLGVIQKPATLGLRGFGFSHTSHNVPRRNFSSLSAFTQTCSQHGMGSRQVFPKRQHMGGKLPQRIAMQPFVRRTANPRGRMLAVGFIAASFLFQLAEGASWLGGSVAATSTIPRPFATRSLSTFSQCIFDIRGGEIDMDSEGYCVPPLEFAHGTTTLSFVFQGGIVCAVDSRASLGSFVGSKTTQKVIPVNSHILGTMAGGAADCMFWIGKLRAEAMLHELKEGCRMTVARASRLLSNSLYENRGLDLSVGTMIMGFDPEDGPPRIFYVDNTGVRIKGDLFAVGSGGTFALGILDNERRYSMTEDEAIALGIKAIRHATFRDAYSGGFINVFLITRDGWRKVYTEDLAGKITSGEKLAEEKLIDAS